MFIYRVLLTPYFKTSLARTDMLPFHSVPFHFNQLKYTLSDTIRLVFQWILRRLIQWILLTHML